MSTLVAPDGGDAQDQGAALAALDIGYVLLPAPADGTLASTLNDVAGAAPGEQDARPSSCGGSPRTAARVRVIEPGGTVRLRCLRDRSGCPARPRRAAAARWCWLSRPAAGPPRSTAPPLQPLRSPVGGWAQAFRLPPGGGTLDSLATASWAGT